MEGWKIIGSVILKMWWLWLPVVVIVALADTKFGKWLSYKIEELLFN